MLDVTEENVDAMLSVKRRLISKTVLMDLNFARNTLAVHSRTNEDVVHNRGSAISDFDELVLLNNIFHLLLFLFSLDGILLHVSDLVCNILKTISIMRSES